MAHNLCNSSYQAVQHNTNHTIVEIDNQGSPFNNTYCPPLDRHSQGAANASSIIVEQSLERLLGSFRASFSLPYLAAFFELPPQVTNLLLLVTNLGGDREAYDQQAPRGFRKLCRLSKNVLPLNLSEPLSADLPSHGHR